MLNTVAVHEQLTNHDHSKCYIYTLCNWATPLQCGVEQLSLRLPHIAHLMLTDAITEVLYTHHTIQSTFRAETHL